jgi:hypothetical protein
MSLYFPSSISSLIASEYRSSNVWLSSSIYARHSSSVAIKFSPICIKSSSLATRLERTAYVRRRPISLMLLIASFSLSLISNVEIVVAIPEEIRSIMQTKIDTLIILVSLRVFSMLRWIRSTSCSCIDIALDPGAMSDLGFSTVWNNVVAGCRIDYYLDN